MNLRSTMMGVAAFALACLTIPACAAQSSDDEQGEEQTGETAEAVSTNPTCRGGRFMNQCYENSIYYSMPNGRACFVHCPSGLHCSTVSGRVACRR